MSAQYILACIVGTVCTATIGRKRRVSTVETDFGNILDSLNDTFTYSSS